MHLGMFPHPVTGACQNSAGTKMSLIDTKGMNRISGKPLKTRDSGTLGAAGIPRLILGLCICFMAE